jgi:hypothetical protein
MENGLKRILEIQKKRPKLTFNNNGYEYINPKELDESDKNAISEINNTCLSMV